MDFSFLSETDLFHGIEPGEIERMMHCLKAITREVPRDGVIHRAGDVVGTMGMVLSGSVSIENDDVWGNRSILDHVGPGQVFAENYACIPGSPLIVNIVAAEASRVLFMDSERMFTVCSGACSCHNRLIWNMLRISAQRNLNLARRILHTSAKTIRGRLLSYLSYQAKLNGGNEFDIPFDRQQLADYLSVDRSAMSSELSKMQRDGLLRVRRSHFVLLGIEAVP